MTKDIYRISYNSPQSFSISSQQYLDHVKCMILTAFQKDPTIVVHSDEEIKEKYAHSIVALYRGLIVGNSNIYPTRMKPLDALSTPNAQKLSVGELWSVIIHSEFRWLWIGKQLTWIALQSLWSKYDAVVSATVNDYMAKIFYDYGFHQIPFPQAYFEEGKKHLWPKMLWWVDEFVQKAKCFLLANNPIKDYIVEILW